MLSPYRVLDLTDDRGHLAGFILATLGAEVIAVEPPGGQAARRYGPYAGDEEGPERSLTHWAFNRGKQSVVLDLATDEGRARLLELARGADVLLESGAPGELAAVGLGPDDLAAVNPALVYVSITAFGQDGPKRDWVGSDLVITAAGCYLALTGDDDRAPLRVSTPQSWHHAAADAAGAAIIALYERGRSGLGQHVDVAAQQSMLQASQSMVLAEALHAPAVLRMAGGVKFGPVFVRLVWPCKDGYVTIAFLFGASIGPFSARLMQWIHEEGGCDEATLAHDWVMLGMQLHSGEVEVAEFERIKGLVEAFCRTKTKAELLDAALTRRLLIAPITTIADVAASEQLASRAYWQEVEHEGLGAVRYPGAYARYEGAAGAERSRPLGRPPKLGEHTQAVLASAVARRPALAPGDGSGPRTGRPLEGVKILDFMWAMAGPAATRALADFGATVVRIESSRKVEVARTIQPFHDNEPDPEGSGLFLNMNAGKLGMALDLSKPGSRDIVFDLVRWADVVTESFSPRAMRGWGMGYDALAAVNPGLIMLSSCLMGQTGPLAMFAGFGNLAAAISGFHYITGWPDRPPAGPFSAYTDYVAPRWTVAVLMAALDHRRRTGEGCYIDFSQAEASLHLLAPALLDYTVNGRVLQPLGNADPRHAPHGVYPVGGGSADQWVALSAETDDQWRALCAEMGRADWAADATLAGAAGRLARREELDAAVAAWTTPQDPLALQERLQARGVPAHQVQNTAECLADPQLAARGHFVTLEHSVHGSTTVEGVRVRLSRTPGEVRTPGPLLGQHTFEVLTDLLGYDEDRVGDLYAAELLE
ncbi:MAG: CaiB/BaiF CoA transferase family protein [Acidimicrobiales bacterium]